MTYESRMGDYFVSHSTRPGIRQALKYANKGHEFNHAGVYIGNGEIVHASIAFRDGVRIEPMSVLKGPVLWSDFYLSPTQRSQIAYAAESYVGNPFPPALPMLVGVLKGHHGDFEAPYEQQPWWVRQILNGKNTMFCSQVVHYAYKEAGIDLFPHHPDGLVTPRNLYDLMMQSGYLTEAA